MGAGRHCMAATHDAAYCDAQAWIELKWIVALLIGFALFACVVQLYFQVGDARNKKPH
jgi:hypothetical protein